MREVQKFLSQTQENLEKQDSFSLFFNTVPLTSMYLVTCLFV